MKFSLAKRQMVYFLLLIIASGIVSHKLYLYTNPQWLIFRQAENKFQDKKWEEAITLYRESFAMGLNNVEAKLRLADAYTKIKDFASAILLYKDYLAIMPNDLGARKALAAALTGNGNFVEAEEEYRQILNKEGKKK